MRAMLAAMMLWMVPVAAEAGDETSQRETGGETVEAQEDAPAESDNPDADSKPGSKAEKEVETSPPPVEVSGQLMLRYTQKLASDADNSAELYNLRVYLNREWKQWRFFAEPRFRQTPLRSFSPSNVWIQQAWVGYDQEDGYVEAHAGLLYRRFGLFWDNSWFGNLPYLNAHKLNPDYGVEARGAIPIVDALEIEYDAQFLAIEDGLNGFFAPESKLTALGASIVQPYTLDFDSSPNHTERHVAIGAIHPTVEVGEFGARLGGSIMTSELSSSVDDSTGRRVLVGGDLTLSFAGASIYGEVSRLTNSGYGDDTGQLLALAGAAYSWERADEVWLQELSARVNGSRIAYDEGDLEERMATAGVHARIHELFGATVEYVWWEFDDDRVVNRIEWILHAYF